MPLPCSPCLGNRPEWQVDSLIAPFVYAEPLASLLKAFKYGGRRALAPALGQLLANRIVDDAPAIDSIVGVPLHSARLRDRTFNQAHEIALALARALDYPCPVSCGVRRVIDTPPQTERSRAERRRFAAGSFAISGNFRGANVAIIDDVITTGATINALATALKTAGAVKVNAWAVARSTGDAAENQAARKT